ncbi:diguanylate cyclase (plasmid) [Pseudomonas nitroreducens]|uniref:GGDEF domain-containing protein n=1 Tax=Pseudomonas nitroreducens TaxID=46680 RepID=UPI0002E8BCCE|nr:diguanylate cyclase [Pseudomonas nitroreducens]
MISSVNHALQTSWWLQVRPKPTLRHLDVFRQVLANAAHALSDVAGGAECEGSVRGLLAVTNRASSLSDAVISEVDCMMEELQTISRRANDTLAKAKGPAALFVSGYGDRSQDLARGLQAMGANVLAMGVGIQIKPEDRESIRRSSMILVGSGLLGDPEGLDFVESLVAASEADALVVLVAESGALSFEQRRLATVLGQVRILSQDDDIRQLRSLFRSRNRDIEIEGYRVLLLDDSRTDAYVAQKIMTEAGLVVEHIQHPSHVLDAISRFRPDVLVSDFHMPDANGDVVASIIRQDRDVTIPIIFLSRESNAERQLLALSRGADGFVQKPLKRDAFIRALKSIVSRSKAVESRMRRDPLTNLLNHGQFMTSAGGVLSEGRPSSLVLIDIDHFKTVNDTFGHPIGDRVLVGLAEVLSDSLRSEDHVGRIGGEEFAIAMVGASQEQAKNVVDRLRTVFTSIQFQAEDGAPFSCSFSAGVSDLCNSVKESIRFADEALYSAKRNGRDRVEVSPGR